MFRLWGLIIGVIATVGVTTASAQSSSAVMSADQVQAEFIRAGFEVDPPVQWTWSSPGLTTFRVRDPHGDRVLFVFVYPDQATADAARASAGRFEADPNPRLIPGFGPSEWQANVAMVQSSEWEQRRIAGSEYEREMEVMVSNGVDAEVIAGARQSTHLVDGDIALLLQGASSSL